VKEEHFVLNNVKSWHLMLLRRIPIVGSMLPLRPEKLMYKGWSGWSFWDGAIAAVTSIDQKGPY